MQNIFEFENNTLRKIAYTLKSVLFLHHISKHASKLNMFRILICDV